MPEPYLIIDSLLLTGRAKERAIVDPSMHYTPPNIFLSPHEDFFTG